MAFFKILRATPLSVSKNSCKKRTTRKKKKKDHQKCDPSALMNNHITNGVVLPKSSHQGRIKTINPTTDV